jgi:hypothetical protein
MKGSITAFIVAVFLATLTGCATKLTVDDGRELDAQLLSDMHAYGAAARALRPAIVRSAALHDNECAHQYELPFEALTSYGVGELDTRMAWARVLGVHENLTVIAADPSSGLRLGDVLDRVDGYRSRNTQKMLDKLLAARDRGAPIALTLASGRELTVEPVTVCRGHVLVAPPTAPALQSYHWIASMHPLEVFHRPLTPDEAAWIVLWTQGLSEQGGVRMKTYAFMMGGLKWLTVFALSAGTSSAVASTRGAAAAAGTSSAGQVAAVHLAGQAASLMAQSAANRASLSGISGVAAGVFEQADKWAFDNMRKLGMNPRAGLTLHHKLVARGAAENAFLFDEKRLVQMQHLARGTND